MNDEAAKLRRELERYQRRFQASSDRQTGKVLRALMAQIEARLREIGSSTSQVEERRPRRRPRVHLVARGASPTTSP